MGYSPEDPEDEAVLAETEAMRKVAAALRPLDPDQRRRVLRDAQRYAAAAKRDID